MKAPSSRAVADLELPFCPQELVSVADGPKLVVADAFGGRLAVVDTTHRSIERLRTLPAHNIRGMAFAPDGGSLVIAHQRLEPFGPDDLRRRALGPLDSKSSANLADRCRAQSGP